MRLFKILIICLTTLQTITAAAAVPKIGETVRFERIGDHIIAVPVILNGRGPFQFVLDTGTDSSIIDTHLAQELGLNTAVRLTLLTAAGQKTVLRTSVQTASVGQAVGRDLELLATNLDSAFHNPSVRGILGQNFLQEFDIVLDYNKGTVAFLSPGAAVPLGGVRVPISLEHGRPALLWNVTANRELRLLLDSGSSSLIFFRTDIPNFHRCILQTCQQTVTTSASAATALSGMLSSLVIGDACLHDVPAAYMSQPAQGDKIDGMLPTALFRIVYINNHERFAVLSGAAPSP
jgi:predicted aspartyl protease